MFEGKMTATSQEGQRISFPSIIDSVSIRVNGIATAVRRLAAVITRPNQLAFLPVAADYSNSYHGTRTTA
jgi:hypothetical protein